MSERIDKIISGIRLAKPDYVVGLDLAEELCAYIEQQRQENANLRERVEELESFIDSPEDVLTRKEGGDDER